MNTPRGASLRRWQVVKSWCARLAQGMRALAMRGMAPGLRDGSPLRAVPEITIAGQATLARPNLRWPLVKETPMTITNPTSDPQRGIALFQLAEDCGFILLSDGRIAGSMYSLRMFADAIAIQAREEDIARGDEKHE